MSQSRTSAGGLSVATVLYDFVVNEALPGTGLSADGFWEGFGALLAAFSPRNQALLERRDALQAKIDAWHLDHKSQPFDAAKYQAFLRQIGYLLPDPAPFSARSWWCR
jgi:malate synthase